MSHDYDTEALAAMNRAAARLGFSQLEVMYCIGRFRTRSVNPLSTEEIAAKFDVSVETLTRYEQNMALQAAAGNPLLHVSMKEWTSGSSMGKTTMPLRPIVTDEHRKAIGDAMKAENEQKPYIAAVKLDDEQ